ncbi:leucyl/phenylalanyl-tRNA--protein transferase [Nocardioides litoris]|uniref:leucyl/phenylalanyl-tRNA--protein transferase n=1 Tax=Nocardioides litoris TaxID=1926648 RepID=UPI001123E261|nr:leucyl/phenylalanyl-tRNA--protein transferase [Nocardioides litoris]
MPVEPPPSRWVLPGRESLVAADDDEADDLVGVGADLEPGTVLAAYRSGLFPMPLGEPGALASRLGRDPVGWWSPVERGVIELDGLKVSRSLRRACRDFEVRVDTAFEEVIDACADPDRPHGWIDRRIRAAYCRLHELGWAHSVETWRDGRLEGGLYGLAIGGLFAGESMFHRARDASKVALVGLLDVLRDEHAADRLVDVQWVTPHLASLGAVELDRDAYLDRLPGLLDVPLPEPWR